MFVRTHYDYHLIYLCNHDHIGQLQPSTTPSQCRYKICLEIKTFNQLPIYFFPINFSFRSEIQTAHNYNMCAQTAAVCLYQQFHNSRQLGELNSVFSANDCENFHLCILKCLHGHVFNANFILLSQTIFCNSVAQWQWLYIISHWSLIAVIYYYDNNILLRQFKLNFHKVNFCMM